MNKDTLLQFCRLLRFSSVLYGVASLDKEREE